MHPLIRLAFTFALLLAGPRLLVLASGQQQQQPTSSPQNYGSFSSGLDQDGGLQPAVGGYVSCYNVTLSEESIIWIRDF